jgi:hypothetical protein
VNAGRRAALTFGGTLVGGSLVIGTALWPVLGPLTQRTPLPAAARSTDAGVPVPETAHRCAVQDAAAAGSVRWCLPGGVSVRTVEEWYDDVLPAGRDSGRLRWCVEQRLDDGSRRALWSTDAGLVGYVLPPEPLHPNDQATNSSVAVEVVVLSGSSCHAVTRVSRGRA